MRRKRLGGGGGVVVEVEQRKGRSTGGKFVFRPTAGLWFSLGLLLHETNARVETVWRLDCLELVSAELGLGRAHLFSTQTNLLQISQPFPSYAKTCAAGATATERTRPVLGWKGRPHTIAVNNLAICLSVDRSRLLTTGKCRTRAAKSCC